MDYKLIILTLTGAFFFPFAIQMAWGKMVEDWGSIGGIVAALLIVGTAWTLNHGAGLIHQSNEVWVDMGLAAGVGVFVSTLLRGGNLKKGMNTILYALIGALIGGFILSLI